MANNPRFYFNYDFDCGYRIEIEASFGCELSDQQYHEIYEHILTNLKDEGWIAYNFDNKNWPNKYNALRKYAISYTQSAKEAILG